MKTVSVINIKGGVGKTTTVQNMAYGLATLYGKRVLVIDNDKQGNISKAFGVYAPEEKNTTSRLLLDREVTRNVIHKTEYERIDIIPANMDLLAANLFVMMDVSRQQQTRYKKAFDILRLEESYDFVLFDHAPDINISVINAFVVTDDIIIPMQMDEYSLDGFDILLDQIAAVREDDFNKNIRLAGCLCTYFQKDEVNMQSLELLRKMGQPVFDTMIRFTNGKPKESVYAQKPLMEYSVRCGASQDYKRFVREYMERVAQIG